MSETGSETNYRSAAFKSMRRRIYAQSSTRPLSLKKNILFAQKVYIIVVRERWRSGYLWVLSLFGTTFLRSVFSWVTLSRSYELRRSSRLLENEKGGEVIEKSSQCEHKALNYGELLQVDKSWSNCNKCWRLVLWCIKTFLMSTADFEGRS